jgi:hypothetical protein
MATSLSMDTQISASETILSSDLGDEVVMMCINKGKYFSLQGPSGRIWKLLETPRTLGEICDVLLEEYDVAPTDCESELIALVAEMHDQELVNITN